MTNMQVPDAARQVGYKAAGAAEGQPANRHNALVAYGAAEQEAQSRNLRVTTQGFTLYPDGRIKLTAHRTAPTLVLHRISAFSHLIDVSTTVTVRALPYTS